jgi:hypothetical protein
MPALSRLRIDGSGDVRAAATVVGDKLDVGIGGSGGVTLAVAVKELTIEVGGSGEVSIKGEATTIGVDVTGSGDVDLAAIAARRARVRVVGSGDVTIRAADLLDVQVTGSADVRYVGAPRKLQKSVTGSGSVRPAG